MTTDWPNISNFRDIGGHLGLDGRMVKTGLLFRGVATSEATDDDLAALEKLGVRLVFDLRGDIEATANPDRLPAGAAYQHESALPQIDTIPRELLTSWDNLIESASQSQEVLEQSMDFQSGVYTGMIRHPAAFAALLAQLVADPTLGVYIHCAAGKDRTGVACIIISRLLGMSREDAMADYLESNNHMPPEIVAVRERARQRGVGELIDLMTSTAKWQFDLAWDEPERAWGSWDAFVRDGLGLSPADVARLRANYLS